MSPRKSEFNSGWGEVTSWKKSWQQSMDIRDTGADADYSMQGDNIPPPYNLDIIQQANQPNRPYYCFRSDWGKAPIGVDETGTWILRHNFLKPDGTPASNGDEVGSWANAYQHKVDGSPLADAVVSAPNAPHGDKCYPILKTKSYPGIVGGRYLWPYHSFRGLEFNGYSFMNIFGGDLLNFWTGFGLDQNSPLYSTAGTTNIGSPYKNTGCSFLFVLDPDLGDLCEWPDGCTVIPSNSQHPPYQSGCIEANKDNKGRIQTLLRGCSPSNFQWREEYNIPPLPQMEPYGVEFYLDGAQKPYWPPTGGQGLDNKTARGPMIFGPQGFAPGGIIGPQPYGIPYFGSNQGMGMDDLSLVARNIPCPPNDPVEYCRPRGVQPLRLTGLQALLIEYDATTRVDHEKDTYSCHDRRMSGPAVRVFGIGGEYYSFRELDPWINFDKNCARFLYRGLGLTDFTTVPWASNDWYEEFHELDPDFPGGWEAYVNLPQELPLPCGDVGAMADLRASMGNWMDTNYQWFYPWSGWRDRTGCPPEWQPHQSLTPRPRSAPAMNDAILFNDKTLQFGGHGPTVLDPRNKDGDDGSLLMYNGFRGMIYEFEMFEGVLTKEDKRKLFKQIYAKYGQAMMINSCRPGHYAGGCPPFPPNLEYKFQPPLIGPCGSCVTCQPELPGGGWF